MVDGTGMCGGCRVTVGGEIKFACVDGPEFDGHLVDFDELAGRQAAYHELDEHGCRMVDAEGNVAGQADAAAAAAASAATPAARRRAAAAPAAPVLTPAPAAAFAVAAAADAPAPALTTKERMAIGRVAMPEQDAEQRSHNFSEVNLGLTGRARRARGAALHRSARTAPA